VEVSDCRNDSIVSSFVSGHDFSRAAKRSKNEPGFSPCHISNCLRLLLSTFSLLANSFFPEIHNVGFSNASALSLGLSSLPRLRRLGYNVAQELLMPANAVVRARIDARVKEEATAIYAAAGLTLSDAFRMMLMRTVAERALPFDPLIPNAETVEAMKAARRGELVKVGSVKDLLADLHAED